MTKSPAVARVGRPYCIQHTSERQRPTSTAERKQLASVTTVLYTLWRRCYIEHYS